MFNLLNTNLYDQDSFHPGFMYDLEGARILVVIESPYITTKRFKTFVPVFENLVEKGVRIVINTKPLNEVNTQLYDQVQTAIAEMQALGILVLFTVGHHRKIAIIDNKIIWEGS